MISLKGQVRMCIAADISTAVVWLHAYRNNSVTKVYFRSSGTVCTIIIISYVKITEICLLKAIEWPYMHPPIQKL